MARIDSLLRQREIVDELLVKEAEKVALAEQLGVVPQKEGEVIFFRKRFGQYAPAYTYAAVCFSKNGYLYWSTTGPISPKNYNWDQLVSWLLDGEGVDELWSAGEWDRVI